MRLCFIERKYPNIFLFLLILASQVHSYPVGWSELALFAIFENKHIAADQEYFLQTKIAEFGGTYDWHKCNRVFLLQKITTDLKQEHIYLSIFESFILLQRTIAKQKIWYKIFRLLFVGPKIGKIVLDIVKGKQICWGVSLNFFKFKTFKSVAGSKNVKIYLVNFTVELQSKFSEAQHQVKLGFCNNLAHLAHSPFLSSKKSLHPTIQPFQFWLF